MYTPDNLTSLDPSGIFVFGSNTEGRHGKGAALIAKKHFGAIYGQATGLQGQSYAICTKDLSRGLKSVPLTIICKQVRDMLFFAKKDSHLTFYVTKLGSSLAGYSVAEIKNIFTSLKPWIPPNVVLPKEYEVRF